MRTLRFAVLIVAVALAGLPFYPVPAWAQATGQNRQRCFNQDPKSADQRIKVCTAIIRSGHETSKTLETAYVYRGDAYGHKGQYHLAIRDFSAAIRLSPADATGYYDRGADYESSGQHDLAIKDYDEAIRLTPDDGEARNNRGRVYANMGRYDLAMRDYEEAIRLKPDDAEAFYNRGNEYVRKTQYDLAIQDYDEAIRLKPDFALAFGGRGYAYEKLGQRDKAAADYISALKLDPKVKLPTDRLMQRGIRQESQHSPNQRVERVAAFDRVPSKQGLGGVELEAALRAQGMTLTVPADQPVHLMNQNDVYGGGVVVAARGNNVLLQNGGHPCQYTLGFTEPLASLSFNRSQLKAGTSGVTHPVWKATAFATGGSTLGSVGEAEISSMSDVAAQRFTLNGPGISQVTFWGDDRAVDGFCNVVIDSMDIQK
jgi:tetratricopeptide (TPR) repeat protein